VEGRRGTLAEYGDAFWGERSRAFARDWDGSGIDHELVDSDRLRQIWSGPPWLHASTLAQAAWLAGARS
jgi:asparagine synthase (glutamine-hydrolysing)